MVVAVEEDEVSLEMALAAVVLLEVRPLRAGALVAYISCTLENVVDCGLGSGGC